MRRIFAGLLLLGLVGGAYARSPFHGHGGVITPPPSIILTGVTLSNNTFPSGASSGTVVGAISVQATGGSFSGSLSLTGTDAASFQISGSNLETQGVLSGGPYSINIVATQSGAGGSPFTQPETITATSPLASLFQVSLVNTSGSTVTTVLSPVMGLQFKKGDVPTWPAFTRDDDSSVCPYSQGLRRNWSDGSIKHLTVRFRCSGTIAGSATLKVNVAAGGSQPSASARTTTELSNALIGMTGVGVINLSGTWTSTLSDGIASAFKWIDGDAGAGWIVDTDFKQSGVAHGQLKARYYTMLTTDNSGNLGGIEFLPRVWQPLYDNDTPAKDWRAFSSLSIQHGAGPTTINIPWPYNTTNFTHVAGSSSTLATTSANYYTGAIDSAGGYGVAPVVLTTTGTLPTGLNTGQLYFARNTSGSTNVILTANSPASVFITETGAGTGVHTMTPVMAVMHFGTIFGATQDATWNYIQSGGSLAAAPTLRATRDPTYWQSTRVIPPWDLSLIGSVADNPSWAYNWNPVTSGFIGLGTPTTGERADIGPFNGYSARHFYNQTAANEKMIRTIGLAAAMMDYQLRDTSKFAPVNVGNSTISYTNFGTSKGATLTWGGDHNAGFNWGFTIPPLNNKSLAFYSNLYDHMPAMTYYAYLWAGTPDYLDLVIEMGNGAIMVNEPQYRNPTLPAPGAKSVATNFMSQVRSVGWALRDLVSAAGIVPDTAPDGIDYKSYFVDSAIASLKWINTNIANASTWTNASGYYNPYAFAQNLLVVVSVWQRSYIMHSTALGTALLESSDGLAALANFSRWYQYQTAHFGDFSRYNYFEATANNNTATSPVQDDAHWGAAPDAIVSWTNANPAVFTVSSSGSLNSQYYQTVTNGDKWIFVSYYSGTPSTSIPGGLTAATPYYVVNASGTSFNLATSPGGTPVATTNSGSTGQTSVNVVLQSNSSVGGTGCCDSSGYIANAMGSALWSKALGTTGLDAMISDALTRLTTTPPSGGGGTYSPTGNPKFAFQSSY